MIYRGRTRVEGRRLSLSLRERTVETRPDQTRPDQTGSGVVGGGGSWGVRRWFWKAK